MQTNLIDNTIKGFIDSGTEAGLVLHDGSVVKGRITDFDGYVVIVGPGSQTVVYRHSILKIADVSSLAERKAQPDSAKQKPQQSQRKMPSRPTSPPKPRQDRRPPRPALQERPAPSGDDFSNPMAEKLAKWLKSQQGGE